MAGASDRSGETAVASPSKWRNGNGPPAAGLGVPGDYYIDNAASNVYYKDVVAGWTLEFNFAGAAGPPGVYVPTKYALGTPTRVTRPNNTVAYASGNIWGAATDARTSFAIPAVPADSATPFFTGCSMLVVHGSSTGAGGVLALDLCLFPFTSEPATVLGDQASIALSDADIALLYPCSVPTGTGQTVSLPSGQTVGGAGNLNIASTTSGRRGVVSSLAFTGGVPTYAFAGGSTLWLYLMVNAAYTPLASETIDFYPLFPYGSRVNT